MTNATWNLVRMAIGELENPPVWLKELARQTNQEIARLPKLDNAAQGQTASPVVEEKEVAKDYLDFLSEQIRLNARDAEWMWTAA